MCVLYQERYKQFKLIPPAPSSGGTTTTTTTSESHQDNASLHSVVNLPTSSLTINTQIVREPEYIELSQLSRVSPAELAAIKQAEELSPGCQPQVPGDSEALDLSARPSSTLTVESDKTITSEGSL